MSEIPEGLRLTCNVTLRAAAQGPGTATWADGVMRFYTGPVRQSPVGSQPISKDEVQRAWGARISATDRPASNWSFWASIPFDVEIEFRFAGDNGAPPPARTRFSCGPTPPLGGAAAPSVTQLSVTPSSGEVQPGDTIRVTYAAASPYALWTTGIRVTGPFVYKREIPEGGARSVARTLALIVPPGSQRDVPVSIAVFAVDPGLQWGDRAVPTQVTVLNRTPPLILSTNFTYGPYGRLAAQFAVGDTMGVGVYASDREALDWLVWEMSAPANIRDSIRARPGATTQSWDVRIPVRAEWVGTPTLSLYVRDVSGLKSATVASPPGGIRFYPLVTHPVTTSAAASTSAGAPGQLGDFVYDAKRGVFYIALQGTKDIAVLEVATMAFRPPIPLSSTVGGVDLSPSGDSLVVALTSSRSLTVTDLERPSNPPTTIRLSVLDSTRTLFGPDRPQPAAVRVAGNGQAIVALYPPTLSGADGIVTVDLATGAQRIRTDARSPLGVSVRAMVPTPDRSRIIVFDIGCPRSYLSASDTFTPCGARLDGMVNYGALSIDSAGQRFSLGNTAFDLSFTRLRVADAILGQMPVSAISVDGGTLYLGAPGTVSTMRIADGIMLERFAIPLSAQRMFMSPTGDWLVVFQDGYPAGRATRVDLR